MKRSAKQTAKQTASGATPGSKRAGWRWSSMALALILAPTIAACGLGGEAKYRDETAEKYEETRGSILGDDRIGVGGEERPDASGGDAGIGVNSYLWRASLDTVSFMPLASADPFGGVIITDWYSPPEATNERFKLNVYILGRDLRADGVRASIFRQLLDPRTGNWVDASVEPQTQTDVENAILTRARELRIASLQ